jgi:hypothetical protein
MDGKTPCLRVRRGKGDKDRISPLNPYITKKLALFVANNKPTDSVFNLSSKTISMNTVCRANDSHRAILLFDGKSEC